MFQECVRDHMEICVTEAEKRETGALNIRDFYTVYLIETKSVTYHYVWLDPVIQLKLIQLFMMLV
jgi:hypothetical protein